MHTNTRTSVVINDNCNAILQLCTIEKLWVNNRDLHDLVILFAVEVSSCFSPGLGG